MNELVTKFPESKFSGILQLVYFSEARRTDRVPFKGRCEFIVNLYICFMTWIVTWWTQIGTYDYTHVEICFSNGDVASATSANGTYLYADKYHRNEGYSKFEVLRISPHAEKHLHAFAASVNGAPFNSSGYYWNSFRCLTWCYVVNKQNKSFYCSEFITTLLLLADKLDGSTNVTELNPHTTTPNQLYVHLSSKTRPGYNERLDDFNQSMYPTKNVILDMLK